MNTKDEDMIPEKTTGFARIIKAGLYSLAGIKAAFQHETAFRQEVFALAVLLPLGLLLGHNGLERAALTAPLLIVIIAELINSALEAIVDRAGLNHHPLAKRAKDLGSAAVFVSIILAIMTWVLLLV